MTDVPEGFDPSEGDAHLDARFKAAASRSPVRINCRECGDECKTYHDYCPWCGVENPGPT